jgi:hypothetical protein
MLQEYFFALALLAGACTAGWLFRPDERATVTTAVAFLSWTVLAVFGGTVEKSSGCCGSTTAAGVPTEIRGILLILALLSFLAFTLHRFGAYPPTNDQPYIGGVRNG